MLAVADEYLAHDGFVHHRISSGVWAGLMLANIALTITAWGVARRRVRRAGERAAHPDRFADSSRKKDVALTVASLVPAALFGGMVLAGSFQGLVAFGRNVLRCNGGGEYLVPGTLDGVSVTFAFLAFWAIHKYRDPARRRWLASWRSRPFDDAALPSGLHVCMADVGVWDVLGTRWSASSWMRALGARSCA